MRIAFFHHTLRRYRRHVFDFLANSYNIRFFFSRNSKESDYSGLKCNYEIHPGKPMLIYSDGFSLSSIKGLLKYNPHIIIASSLTSFQTHMSFIYAKLLRRKFIVFIEDWAWWKSFSGVISYPIARLILMKSDAVVAASRSAEIFAENAKSENIYLGLNSAVHFLDYPINNEKIEKMKQGFKDKKIILYLSRIIKIKGLDVLLRAFSIVEKTRDDCVLIVGGDGPFRGFCEQLANDLDLRNCIFLGYSVEHTEVPYYFKICDVFVLPSRFLPTSKVCCEAWGMVLNEAMSLRKPIVSTTAAAAARDLIESGKNGYLVEPENPQKMADAILKILNCPDAGQYAYESILKVGTEQQFDAFSEAIKFVAKKGL